MNDRFLRTDQAMSKEIAKDFGEGYINPKPQIEIDEPEAMPGDTVTFVNYRCKSEPVSIGRVVHVETHWLDKTKYQHKYIIKPEGKKYRVKVRIVELIKRGS